MNTQVQTAKAAGIVAFLHSNDTRETIRVYDMVDHFKVEYIDGSNCRWFSTHSALTLEADVRMALESYTGEKVLQRDIDFNIF